METTLPRRSEPTSGVERRRQAGGLDPNRERQIGETGLIDKLQQLADGIGVCSWEITETMVYKMIAAGRMQFNKSRVTQQAVTEIADASAPSIRKHYTNLTAAWKNQNANANADATTPECNETAAP